MHVSLRGTDFECTFRHAENMAQVLNCFCWCQKFCRFFAFFPETSPFVSVAVMSSLSLMANKETRTILRFRNLLRTVIEDNLFASKSMMTAPSMWQFQTLEILGPVITQPLDPTTMVRSRQRGVISSVCGTRGSATIPRRPYRKHPGSTRP